MLLIRHLYTQITGGSEICRFIGLLLFFQASLATAHLPHDDITLLEISPNFSNDQFMLITERKNLLRSTDGGDRWKRLVRGLDYDSEITSIFIAHDFERSGTIYIATNGDGIYKSQDSGNSWRKTNTGLTTLRISLLYGPRCPDKEILYAAGEKGDLFKCENGEDTWVRVLNQGTLKITSMTASRNCPQQLLLGGEAGVLGVFDCETNSLDILSDDSDRGVINTIVFPPHAPSNNTFLIGTQKSGAMRTDDGGLTFEPMGASISDQPVMSLVFSPDYDHDRTLYASTWYDGVFCSKDAGKTWQRISDGLTTDPQAEKGHLPHFRKIKLSNDFRNDGVMFLNGFDALFKSTDHGHVWEAVETLPAKLIVDFDISPAYGEDGQVAWVTYAGAACIMDTSHGCSFNISNSGIGYYAIRRPVIKFSPDYDNDQSIFSASNNVFLKSPNCGDLWKSYRLFNIPGLPRYFEKFVQNAEYMKRRYVATMVIASPDISADQTIYMATRKNGLFRSTNGGKTFNEIFNSQQFLTTALAVSPDFSNDHVLFIGITGDNNLYKTTDRGDSWQPADTEKIIEGKINCISISPDFHADRMVFVGTRHGIYKTENAGDEWEKVSLAAFNGHHHVDAIAISPNFKNDREMIVSIRGEGIFKSHDAGGRFFRIGKSLIENNHHLSIYFGFPEKPLPIKYSPNYQKDHTVYGTTGEELFVSTNGGHDWKMIPRPVRYEDFRRDVIRYDKEDNWVKKWKPKDFDCDNLSANSITICDVKDAKAVFKFNGSGVTWTGTQSRNQGIANVYIDGRMAGRVDQYSSVEKAKVELFTIRGLENRPHTLTIEVTGDKAKASEGYATVIDAIDIYPYD